MYEAMYEASYGYINDTDDISRNITIYHFIWWDSLFGHRQLPASTSGGLHTDLGDYISILQCQAILPLSIAIVLPPSWLPTATFIYDFLHVAIAII